MAEKKERCMLASEAYVQDMFYINGHFSSVENFREHRMDDGNWEFHFRCDDQTMLEIINLLGFKLNWQPLKIGVYYV